MNKVLIALTTTVVAALPAVASAAPAWCGSGPFKEYSLKYDLGSKDVATVVPALALATCAPNDEAKTQLGEIESARQAWGKRLGMSEDDWADVIAFTKVDKNSITWDYSTKDLSQFTALDQYQAVTHPFHASNGGGAIADDLYMADAFETKLTEAGRLARIELCISSNALRDFDDAAKFALCEGDIKRFDPAKLATDLRADTAHSGDARMYVRFHAYGLKARLKDHQVVVDKILKIDPAYKKMFDLAEQGRTEWSSGVGANAKLLQLAMAMDSATFFESRNQFAGCEDKTRAALEAEISKLPARTFAKMMDVRSDPTVGFAHSAQPLLAASPSVHVAAAAFIECQPNAGISPFLSAAVQHYPGQRGPRSAGLGKLTAANLQLDDMSEHIEYPEFQTRPYVLSSGTAMSAGGVIQSVKPGPEFITVEFVKETITEEECVTEHHSHDIERVEANGTVLYALVCDKSAMVTHDHTVMPMKIEPEYAKVLKPGVRISVVFGGGGGRIQGGESGQPKKSNLNLGAVVAVWSSKGAKLPSAVLGAPVK